MHMHLRSYLDFSTGIEWQQGKSPGAVFRIAEFDSWFSP